MNRRYALSPSPFLSMNRIARVIGLAAGFLLLFLAILVLSQQWLRHQTDRLREEALQNRRSQLQRTVALAHAPPPPWDDKFIHDLGEAIDATIAVLPASTPAGSLPAPGRWQ